VFARPACDDIAHHCLRSTFYGVIVEMCWCAVAGLTVWKALTTVRLIFAILGAPSQK
jgi:hypothetical protein